MKVLRLILFIALFLNCNETNITEIQNDNDAIINDSIVDIISCYFPERNTNDSFYFQFVENPPEYNNTPSHLSVEEKRKFFNKKIKNLVLEEFNINQGYICLSGVQRIFIAFEIDKNGNVKNIRVRAPHPVYEKEAKRVIKLLPQFTPAKHKGEDVSSIYNLPIAFRIED